MESRRSVEDRHPEFGGYSISFAKLPSGQWVFDDKNSQFENEDERIEIIKHAANQLKENVTGKVLAPN